MSPSKSHRHIWLGAVAAAALSLPAVSASAAVCAGACGTAAADGDVTLSPSGASTYGWISTFGGVAGGGQLSSVGGTDGSSFTTSVFTANAGDNLQYYFNFVSSDGQDGVGQFIFEDYAFVQLLDGDTGTPLAMLFNARTEPTGAIVPGSGLPPISPGVTLTPDPVTMSPGSGPTGGPNWSPLGSYSGQCWGPGCGLTGWIKSDYTVATAGNYKLVFGVTNWGDTIYDTGLAFSGLNIGGVPIEDSVPEPAVWWMMIIGFGALGAALRSRKGVTLTA
jgi:hypothetical protein